MSLVWGLPYLFIKIAVEDGVPPVVVAWGRVALGALVLLPFVIARGSMRGLRGRLRWVAAFGLCEIAVSFPLISIGEVHVTSSLAAILIAALPLVVAVVTLWIDPEERVSRARLGGLLCGFAGVVLLMGIDVAGDRQELIGALCVLGATIGYALGPMVVRMRLNDADPLGVTAGALVFGAIVLAPSLVITPVERTPSTGAIAAMIVLGVVCSALALAVFFALIVEAGPTRATVITYVNPVVAVLLGVLLLDEHLGTASVVGLLLILAGSWTATGGSLPRLRRAAPA
jgi:drug/metabolite transporter (DMT)-like permease